MAAAGRPPDGVPITGAPIPDMRRPRQQNSGRQVAVVPQRPWVLRGRWHMKTQAKDAVALAMDWLAQLREEDGAGPPPGGGQPATDSAPPAGDFTGAAPIAPPAGDFTDAAPAQMPAADYGDAGPAAYGDAGPAAPPVDDSWPAARHAGDFRDADPTAPAAGDSRPAAPAGDFREPAPPAPPTAGWGDAAPPAPPAGDAWRAGAPPAETASAGRAGRRADVEITERAAIGDELRIPLAWCEMGSCIARHADPSALGEADIRARAIAAGWRLDALGRLVCPQCQQGDSWFWTAHPVALWDRETAVAMTTLMAAAMREIASAGGAAGAEPGAVPGGEPGAAAGGELGAVPGGEPGAVAGGGPGVVPGPRPEMARPPGRGRHRGHPAHADRAQ
jgi:hypothetical protein